MKLYQPMLFVGLGGTGCQIGAELERRFREELCGPDGTEFMQRRPGANLLPYQLPSCVQFVYSDVNRAELDRLPRRVVPGTQYVAAAEQTAQYVRDLVPSAYTYPEVARSLRLSAGDVVSSWLPPPTGEPRVSPLDRGAGQFPTVGRAALFETFRGGVTPALTSLQDAIGHLATSGADLHVLGGPPPQSCDVFVAFSVAGGTGTGIFYDYLHLIGHAFAQSELRIKIYPLILMPSAFEEGRGGGRFAQLNAGRGLLDMFRLVDHQNSGGVSTDLTDATQDAATPQGVDDVGVRYPVEGRISLPPSTVQTAFLFSRPTGATREDLHRSVVALVLSLAGTELDDRAASALEQTHQSFADSFINSQAEREVAAESGIGNRGVSTGLVASLTVPVDELSDIIGSRLLRDAVTDMRATGTTGDEHNLPLIREFFAAANLKPLLDRRAADHAQPPPVTGAKEIATALHDRAKAMRSSLAALRDRLTREAPDLAHRFDHRAAMRELLGTADVDPFRARRVVRGNAHAAERERPGVIGIIQNMRNSPSGPAGMGATPPPPPQIRDRVGGLRKARWGDGSVMQARNAQDSWYTWQSNVAWAEAWAATAPRWTRAVQQLEVEITGLTDALEEHAVADADRFEKLSAELYRDRVGVSYLLPPVSTNLGAFYHQVCNRLRERLVAENRVSPGSTEAGLVRAVVTPEGWRRAYDIAVEDSPQQAVIQLRETLKTAIKQFLREPGPNRAPLLPRLSDLLAHTAAEARTVVGDEHLEQFRAQLAGLLPAGYRPQGAAPLKVLITYHAATANPRIEQYLREAINLPRGAEITYEFRPVSTETISVVLFRSSMSVTEVREVREVMRLWADSRNREQPQDYLRWRQRLGYDFGYLATTEEHRVLILHRLLNALWNGRVAAVGDPYSPEKVRFTMGGGVTMQLDLSPLEDASSWGSLLRSYEHWAFGGEDTITRQFCAQLMNELPIGVDARPREPDKLYRVVRSLAEDEVRRLDELARELHSVQRGRAEQMRAFWAQTLPAALEREFQGTEALRANLAALEQAVRRRRGQGADPPEDSLDDPLEDPGANGGLIQPGGPR